MARQCQNCQRHVTEQFVRVFGLDGEVDHCPDCATVRELTNGEAASRNGA